MNILLWIEKEQFLPELTEKEKSSIQFDANLLLLDGALDYEIEVFLQYRLTFTCSESPGWRKNNSNYFF
ncbi:MAG: hypothetical protein JWQ25_2292 [Daejeonella sp.]|nr:hypothetical protein [Daejeonella sp.]